MVTATGSRLRVLTADAPSAYGLRPDWIAVDELAEWRTRALWDSLWSAMGKRARCRMLVITTPGWDRTGIAWEVRQVAEREANWYLASRGPCAGWIDPAWRAQQERTLPSHVFARLHLGRWVEGAGAFLSAAEVDGVFITGRPAARKPVRRRRDQDGGRHGGLTGGTYVTIHSYHPSVINSAIGAGVKDVGHGHLLDERTLRRMADKGVFLSIQPFTVCHEPELSDVSNDKLALVCKGTALVYESAKKRPNRSLLRGGDWSPCGCRWHRLGLGHVPGSRCTQSQRPAQSKDIGTRPAHAGGFAAAQKTFNDEA